MASVDVNMKLAADQRSNPVLWVLPAPAALWPLLRRIDVGDEAMRAYLPDGNGMALKSFGHTTSGVHFLLTRKGTTVHTDKAYTRYSHQLVLRNDGNRIRGLPRYDSPDQTRWHPPLLPGTMYALDTHSPHQGLHDPRIAPAPGMKAVIAVDRDTPIDPADAWALFLPWLEKAVQFRDVADREAVLGRTTAPRWRDKA
jgi:hypothetical protein